MSISATLKAQLQNRMSAVTAATDEAELFKLVVLSRLDTFDTSALAAAVAAKSAAVTGATTLANCFALAQSSSAPAPVSGYVNKARITTSGNWIVPPGVYELEVWVTAGGGAGGASASFAGISFGASAGAASGTLIMRKLAVRPGDILNIVIGAGATAPVGSSSLSPGGNTSITLNGVIPLAVIYGGASGIAVNSSAANPRVVALKKSYALFPASYITGGYGGRGGPSGGVPSEAGGRVELPSVVSGDVTVEYLSTPASTGGTAGDAGTPGGAGGSSIYGPGGNATNGFNNPTSRPPVQGTDAPAANYGAGGGGASGGNQTPAVKGGSGTAGVVDIYY